MEALAEGGIDRADTVSVIASLPGQAGAVTSALARLGVGSRKLAFDQSPYLAPARMHPRLGPCLTFHVAAGPPCSLNCEPGCRCGRFLLLAYLHFRMATGRSGTLLSGRPVFEAVILESSLLSAAGGTADPYGSTRLAPLINTIRDFVVHEVHTSMPARSLRLLTDRSFTAALLLGAGAVPGARGPDHVVRRPLRQAGAELVRFGSTLDQLPRLVREADRLVRVPLGLPPLTSDQLALIDREMEAFSRVLASGRDRFLRELRPGRSPEDHALNLWRLHSVHGVPLNIAMTWYREHALPVSLRHCVAVDFAARSSRTMVTSAGTVHRPGTASTAR